MKVDDRAGGSASIPVTITVNDVAEPPSAPPAPRVTATKDTGLSLDVTWNAPRDTGKPPITDYDIQYRKFKTGSPDNWQLWPHGTATDAEADNTDRSAEITRRLPALRRIDWSPGRSTRCGYGRRIQREIRLKLVVSRPGYDRP